MKNTLAEQIHALLDLKKHPKKNAHLPSGATFLDTNVVLMENDHDGDARHPYAEDGLTLWAYSSGNISVQESTFNFFLDSTYGREPYIAFFLGYQKGEEYLPLSITGVGRTYDEGDVSRYLIYTPEAAFYFLEKDGVIAVLRAFVDTDKHLQFSLYAENQTEEEKNVYLSSYFCPLLRYRDFEGFEDRWYKSLETTPNGYRFHVTEYRSRTECLEHDLFVKTHVEGKLEQTTGRALYCGNGNQSLSVSGPLRKGYFPKNRSYTRFIDDAALGEIAKTTLKPHASFALSYEMGTAPLSEDDALEAADKAYAVREEKEAAAKRHNLHLSFQGWKEPFQGQDETFACFLDSALYQNEFVATAKNYAGPFEGTRDVYQQLESFSWIEPEKCRKKLWEGLNFISDDGRCPRQYSFPPDENTLPAMDLREYIDQGEWIIEAFYRYLTITGDYALLNETAGYYRFEGSKMSFSKRKDSVLDHLDAILSFLESNLDKDTGCLHILYGDWNDAVDGLGASPDPKKSFGSGVSVMASLGLLRNFREMTEILRHLGISLEKANHYEEEAKKLEESLLRYGVTKNALGERKILHGWNDGRKEFVGSFQDADDKSRDSLMVNACWVLGGMLDKDPSLKETILGAYKRLDSKYGLKTFIPGFGPENKMVGRINRLPIGTAENGSVYVHASLFAIWSLFQMGEVKLAYEELAKALPFTHQKITTSPFVMSNSYMHNDEMGIDGESMNDWFTGSVTVLIKVLFEEIFGCHLNLESVTIAPAKNQPLDSFQADIPLRKSVIHLTYENHGNAKRVYLVNGAAQNDAPSFLLKELPNSLDIKVID